MENRPWYKYYDGIPNSLNYPKTTLYERFKQTAEKYPDAIAWEFLGSTGTYRELLADIDQFANGLASQGFNEGDYMTISMPTSPQGVIPIYAVNKLGGVAAMIHPLNPPAQIKMYLNITKSRWALTLDAFYNNFNEILPETSVEKIIISKIPDYLGVAMSFGFWLTKGRKIPKIPKTDSRVINFMDLMKKDYPSAALVKKGTDDCAIILFSGGTTGEPKGIKLSNLNIISEGMMAGSWGKIGPGDRILAILPIFHGFGLGVCINGAFMMGSTSIMVPTFTPETVAELIKKKRPQIVIGVPTLYDALCNNPDFQKTDLSCLKICFSGADTLPRSTKEKFEEVVRNGGGNIKLLEGYGLTEAVTAIIATPINHYREGSIGVPWPDMDAKIVKMDSIDEQDLGEEGELVIRGPAVMLGYLNAPEQTADVLKVHSDGKTWLHTGDICYQDEDGFFYFKLRQKRMFKVSGVNCYPKRVEEVIRKHPNVQTACVIGVPDKKQISKVKAFVVLKDSSSEPDEVKKSIQKFCLENLLKWESPREIEFRKELPLTLVGKIAFNELEKEELAKLKEAGKFPFDN